MNIGKPAVLLSAAIFLGGGLALAPSAEAASTGHVAPAATVSCVGSGYGYPALSSDGGSEVCFNPTGEHLKICDGRDDGHHPGAWYSISGAIPKNVSYDVGYGNCHDLNLSIPETGYISYQACNYEKSAQVGECSEWVTVNAGG